MKKVPKKRRKLRFGGAEKVLDTPKHAHEIDCKRVLEKKPGRRPSKPSKRLVERVDHNKPVLSPIYHREVSSKGVLKTIQDGASPPDFSVEKWWEGYTADISDEEALNLFHEKYDRYPKMLERWPSQILVGPLQHEEWKGRQPLNSAEKFQEKRKQDEEIRKEKVTRRKKQPASRKVAD